MTHRTFAGAVFAIGMMAATAAARDPGLVDTRGRRTPPPAPAPRFIPERVDVTQLHGPVAAPRERRRLYERVEDDVDRGRGRIEDERTYEVRRLQDDRDERLRRIEPRRESERFEEEYDRNRRLDARVRAARAEQREADSTSRRGAAAGETSPTTIVRPTDDSIPDPGGSALARFVAEQEQLLSAAGERYQADLRAAEAERDAAARAGGTQRARAQAERRFAERRAQLTREYQQYRRGILGSN
jgi:hypothetical protein